MSKKEKSYDEVYLNVYLLAPEQTTGFHNMLGLAPYHSGVVFRGNEWTFSAQGVFSHKPKGIDHKFYKAVPLGKTKFSSFSEINSVMEDLKKEFKGSQYHPTKRNCNHFANALSKALLDGKGIPSWVNRVAGIGKFFSKFIPQKTEKKMIESAQQKQFMREFEKDAERGEKESGLIVLNSLIKFDCLECLNESSKYNIKQFMKGGFLKKKILESEADDEQMILYVEFQQKVNMCGISIGSKAKGKCPKIVKLFTNEKSLDFENVEDLNPKAVLNVDVKKAVKGHFFDLNMSTFRNVVSINIWIEENHGGSTSVINSLKFFGKSLLNTGLNMGKFEEVQEQQKNKS